MNRFSEMNQIPAHCHTTPLLYAQIVTVLVSCRPKLVETERVEQWSGLGLKWSWGGVTSAWWDGRCCSGVIGFGFSVSVRLIQDQVPCSLILMDSFWHKNNISVPLWSVRCDGAVENYPFRFEIHPDCNFQFRKLFSHDCGLSVECFMSAVSWSLAQTITVLLLLHVLLLWCQCFYDRIFQSGSDPKIVWNMFAVLYIKIQLIMHSYESLFIY